MTERMTGGCACGAVRYELARPPYDASICHCRMCQRATGGYFAPLASVELKDFILTKGKLAIYVSSPVVERGFCAQCGSPLTFRYVDEDEISVAIPSLDAPDRVAPTIQYGTESMSPHFHGLSALPGETTEASMSPEVFKRIPGN